MELNLTDNFVQKNDEDVALSENSILICKQVLEKINNNLQESLPNFAPGKKNTDIESIEILKYFPQELFVEGVFKTFILAIINIIGLITKNISLNLWIRNNKQLVQEEETNFERHFAEFFLSIFLLLKKWKSKFEFKYGGRMTHIYNAIVSEIHITKDFKESTEKVDYQSIFWCESEPDEYIPVKGSPRKRKESGNKAEIIPSKNTTRTMTADEFQEYKSSLDTLPQINQFQQDTSDNDQFANSNFPWSKKLETQNRSIFGNSAFRKNQLPIMNAALSNNDCFVLMPTGGGKSLCYQLPASISEGLTIVVSPLISLMVDQVGALKSLGIKAEYIGGAQSWVEFTNLKILYVTPEKIGASAQFNEKVKAMHNQGQISRIVIDEAHCVSKWGHDFRPSYLGLSKLRDSFPGIPLMAVTATANEKVQKDIQESLKMENCAVFGQSLNRTNLIFKVKKDWEKQDISNWIQTKYNNESGIIYCYSKKNCEEFSQFLNSTGISCDFYHASRSGRNEVQEKWGTGQIKVVCATVAFGMGIDKSNVRFVVHLSMPKSIEDYFQEAGRAGRDGKPAKCIVNYRKVDKSKIAALILSDHVADKNDRIDGLKTMSLYATSIECRRKFLLSFLGEKFDPKDCDLPCDNCGDKRNVEVKDYSVEAKDLLSLVHHLENIRKRVETTTMVIDIFYGSTTKKLLQCGLDKVAMYGSGKQIGKRGIEQLVNSLLSQGYLSEDYVAFGSNFAIAAIYLKLGPKFGLILNENKIFEMFERVRKPKKEKKKIENQNSKMEVVLPQPNIGVPDTKKRNLNQINGPSYAPIFKKQQTIHPQNRIVNINTTEPKKEELSQDMLDLIKKNKEKAMRIRAQKMNSPPKKY